MYQSVQKIGVAMEGSADTAPRVAGFDAFMEDVSAAVGTAEFAVSRYVVLAALEREDEIRAAVFPKLSQIGEELHGLVDIGRGGLPWRRKQREAVAGEIVRRAVAVAVAATEIKRVLEPEVEVPDEDDPTSEVWVHGE